VSKLHAVVLLASILFLVSCNSTSSTLTLALLGDLMIGRGVNATPASLIYLAPELQAADLRLANLESPLAAHPPPDDSGAVYNLCAPASRASLLSTWGLDLLSVQNNHRFDCGPDGPTENARILTAAGIAPIGAGPGALFREVHGLKLAFLAFDDISVPMNVEAAVRAIQSARTERAEVVISLHWGAEYQAGATERQKALAQQLAQAGAALIVGTHPHVLQPAAWISTSHGKTLVLYSLGNALFDQPGLPDTRQSALVLVRLDAHGVQSVHLVPFVINIAKSRLEAPDAQVAQQIRLSLALP
jgi:poly-gamma-glutamate capsule biosynthesis protein CapA/YwtB (metallophosphatase superfamily)